MAEDNKKEPVKKTKVPTERKRDAQSIKKNLRNRSFKTSVRTAIVSLEKGISEKESKETLGTKLGQVYSLMDKGVKKGIFKKNKASRIKARYTKRAVPL